MHKESKSNCPKEHLDAFGYRGFENMEALEDTVRIGLNAFKEVFGFASETMIAPCYLWDNRLEKAAMQNGIRAFQGGTVQKIPTTNGFEKRRHYMGQKGKPKKVVDEETYKLIEPVVDGSKDFDEEEIIARMMIPLCLETVRCLEDNIVEDPADADMGLIYGIGFPPFRGGALRYIDDMGVDKFVELADKYADLGPLYAPTEKLREMAKTGKKFFG